MNEPIPYQPDRANGAAQFFSKVQRYKTLLKRRWWVLLLTLGIAIGAQTYRASQVPVTYVSKAQMIMGTRPALPDASGTASDENFVGTTIALLKGNLITSRTTDALKQSQPDLAPSPVTLDVSLAPKTSIFMLQARGQSRKYTQAYLDVCMDEFLKYRQEIRGKSSEETVKAIMTEVKKIQTEMDRQKQELDKFKTSNNVAFVVQEAEDAGKLLGSLKGDLTRFQTEYRLLETMTTLPGGLEQKNQGANATAAAIEFREIDRARQQIEVLKAQRHVWSEVLKDQHPKMLKFDADIVNQEQLLKVYQSQTQEQLANHRAALKQKIDNLQSVVKEQEVKALEASRRLNDYENLRSALQRTETLHAKILSTLDNVKLVDKVPLENVSVLEKATLATADNTGFTKQIIIGCFIGLVCGIGLLFLLDRFDDRPVSFTELQEHFDELVLGQIPQDSTRNKDRRLLPLTANDTRYAYAEAHRNLRSSLIFMAIEGSRPRTIVVTSAVPGEGKSTVTVNLAITMALSGSRVLLIDADLRKGTVHEYFELADQPGLSDVLAGEVPWDRAVQQTHLPNLHVLARGNCPPNPGELILSGADVLLRDAHDHFDFILFDSAPVLAADDTASLAPKVDGTLFVIRAAYTSARLARTALELLYQRQVNVMGLVFNSVETSSREYYYFKYPEYYHSNKLAHK